MNLTISGHHLEVTPALRGYVTQKLDRINRHFDQVVDVRVILSIEKQKEKERRQRAECNIHVKGSDLFAESCSEDLYAAVDELVDKLDRQVVRHKDRLQDHGHTSPKRAEIAEVSRHYPPPSHLSHRWLFHAKYQFFKTKQLNIYPSLTWSSGA